MTLVFDKEQHLEHNLKTNLQIYAIKTNAQLFSSKNHVTEKKHILRTKWSSSKKNQSSLQTSHFYKQFTM